MNRTSKDILDRLKSGQYFADAKIWYARKYLYPVIERSILILSILLIGCLFMFLIDNLQTVNAKNFKENFAIQISDLSQKYAKINKIAENSNDSYQKLIEYLITDYTINFESYHFSKLSQYNSYIKENSSKQLHRRYFNSVSTNNPNSPIFLYGRSTIREIKINKIIYEKNKNYARVYFTSQLINKQNGKISNISENEWLADIQFDLPKFNEPMTKKDSQKLKFIVIDYQTKKLK